MTTENLKQYRTPPGYATTLSSVVRNGEWSRARSHWQSGKLRSGGGGGGDGVWEELRQGMKCVGGEEDGRRGRGA